MTAIQLKNYGPLSIVKYAQMKLLQSLGYQEIHTLVKHNNQLESSSIDLGSLHRILPLPRTDFFYGIAKEV